MQWQNDTEFWKCVKKSTRKPVPLSSEVNCNIADMWRTHFSELLNSVSDNTNKLNVEHFSIEHRL